MPKWGHWKNISTPETWEVIALSLNREPREMLEQYGEIALLHSSGRRRDEKPEYAAYLDRAHQVLDAAKWASINNSDPGKRWVAMKMPTNIASVAALASDYQWDAPQEFLALAVDRLVATKAPADREDGERWKAEAQNLAREFIKQQKDRGLYPSQNTIADQVARMLRDKDIFGADGKPLTGSTIKRHALKGISSATGKQLSTSVRRSK